MVERFLKYILRLVRRSPVDGAIDDLENRLRTHLQADVSVREGTAQVGRGLEVKGIAVPMGAELEDSLADGLVDVLDAVRGDARDH